MNLVELDRNVNGELQNKTDFTQFFDFWTNRDMEKYIEYLSELNKYSIVNLNGSATIIHKEFKNNKYQYEFANYANWKLLHNYMNVNINVSDSASVRKCKSINVAEWWLKQEHLPKRYRSVVFDPSPDFSEKPENNYLFNFWEGFIPPVKCDITRFHEYLKMAFEPSEAEYIVKVLAWTVQNPHKLARVGLVLLGGQGTGKSTVSELMKRICPNNSIIEDDINRLFNDFNSHTVHSKYMLIEETKWEGINDNSGLLKSAITSTDRNIRIKNHQHFNVQNFTFYIFTSNKSMPIVIDRDDRRFNVFASKEVSKDKKYWNELYDWFDDEGASGILYYFLNEVDLTGFDPRDLIETKARINLKIESLEPTQKFFYDFISGHIETCELNPIHTGKDWLDKWNHSELRIRRDELYLLHRSSGSWKKVSESKFSKDMGELLKAPSGWARAWKGSGNSPSYFKLPPVSVCMELFADYIKSDVANVFGDEYTKSKRILVEAEMEAKKMAEDELKDKFNPFEPMEAK